MHILNARQAAEADRRAIEDLRIPGRTLMETAGRRIAESLMALDREPVLLLCGRGGNGGDGLVALRTLASWGVAARAVVLAPRARLTRNTRANLRAANRLGCAVRIAPDPGSWEELIESRTLFHPFWTEPAVIVDAMLGTGAEGPLRGLLRHVVVDLGRRHDFDRALRVAVDVPTGLSSDTGALPSVHFRADRTIALGAPKICHAVYPARDACGALEVAEIGIPRRFLESGETGVRFIGTQLPGSLLPRRNAGAHKGSMGRLLIVAGSRRMPGAAVLAARGALGAGVGLLTVAGPASALAGLPPEAMRLPLPEDGSGWLAPGALAEIRDVPTDALVVGPGLGAGAETAKAVRELVRGASAPLVLDADGLNAFAGRAAELAERPALALTPHPGEAARLLGRRRDKVAAERLESVRALARETSNAVLLKGPGSLVAEPGRAVFVNPTGGPELASGGTGDVLAGVAGAFLARMGDPGRALTAAAYLHGRAGELARERYGEDGVDASTVARFIGRAIRSMREDRAR